jgi:diguanylate cyclase (GGDEF)-like protein
MSSGSQHLRASIDMLAHSHVLASIFIILAIALNLLITAYWQFSLEPRLTAQANGFAQAQAGILSKLLSNKTHAGTIELELAMDTILELHDPATQMPIVQRIEVILKDTSSNELGVLEVVRGNPTCQNCLTSEVPLLNEQTGRSVGTARIQVNRNFLTRLQDDLQIKLWWSGFIVTCIVFFTWLLLENFLRKLRKNESSLQSIIDGVADPLYVYSTDRSLIFKNQAAHELALSNHGMDDSEFQQFIHPPATLIRDVTIKKRPTKCILKIPQNDNKPLRLELQANPLSDGSNEITGIIVTYRDLTEHLELLDELQNNKHQLQQLAEKDTLTQLPNRLMFNRLLDQAVSRALRNHSMLALLFLDLDRFKEVNDSLGHDAGDTLLEVIAQRLLTAVRKGDVVSRISGDEFVVLLADIRRPDDATLVADHILESVREMVTIQGKRFHPSVSIGISLFPNDGRNGKLLMQSADTAMYRAKRQSQNSYQLYDPSMTLQIQDRMNTIAALQSAVNQDQFVLLYQPQYELHTKKLIGIEALLRWNKDDQQLVSPTYFLDLAEDVGLVYPIGQWVLFNVCRQIVNWRNLGYSPPPMAINISSSELLHKDFVSSVQKALRETKCEGKWLTFEITESCYSSEVDRAIEILKQLKSLDITIAVDDFGTQHSSLACLKQLPIDRLKLDKSFLENLSTDSANQAITQTVQDFGHRLGIEVLAEGVETSEQETYLILCDYRMAQGYRYGRPMSAELCEKRLH